MIKVGTHDGQFHCDEALACAMLQILYPDMVVVRSRNPNVLETCDIVVDVGAVYDPDALRFDHHQRSFTETFERPREESLFASRMSSAGLVYKHFGAMVLQTLYPSLADDMVDRVHRNIYYGFVHHIDAVDNGENITVPGVQASTLLSGRVRRLNRVHGKGFADAVRLCRDEFEEFCDYYIQQCVTAYPVLQRGIDHRLEVSQRGNVVHISHWVPWELVIHDLEVANDLEGVIEFVVYKAKEIWRVMCVRTVPGQYETRQPLAERLRGLSNEALNAAMGRTDLVFVHNSGFTGGATTYEGVMALISASCP